MKCVLYFNPIIWNYWSTFQFVPEGCSICYYFIIYISFLLEFQENSKIYLNFINLRIQLIITIVT